MGTLIPIKRIIKTFEEALDVLFPNSVLEELISRVGDGVYNVIVSKAPKEIDPDGRMLQVTVWVEDVDIIKEITGVDDYHKFVLAVSTAKSGIPIVKLLVEKP